MPVYTPPWSPVIADEPSPPIVEEITSEAPFLLEPEAFYPHPPLVLPPVLPKSGVPIREPSPPVSFRGGSSSSKKSTCFDTTATSSSTATSNNSQIHTADVSSSSSVDFDIGVLTSQLVSLTLQDTDVQEESSDDSSDDEPGLQDAVNTRNREKKNPDYKATYRFPSLMVYCDIYTRQLLKELLLEVSPVAVHNDPGEHDRASRKFTIHLPCTKSVMKCIAPDKKGLMSHPFYKGQVVFVNAYGEHAVPMKIVHLGTGVAEDKVLWAELDLSPLPWVPYSDLPFTRASTLYLTIGTVSLSRVCTAMEDIWKMEKGCFQKEVIRGMYSLDQIKIELPARLVPKLDINLNTSQVDAVEHSLNHAVSMIRGPPGTGKTATIYALILELVSRGETPIIVSAASNVAVDNVGERLLMDSNINFLRVVSMAKESTYTDKHVLAPRLLHLLEYERLSERSKSVYRKLKSNIAPRPKEYKAFMKERSAATEEIKKGVDVFLTTSVAAGGRQFSSMEDVNTVILDEATQSSEPSTLILLAKKGLKRFVLVGDEKQLSAFSEVQTLKRSLYERMMLNESYPSPNWLDTQYRMHSVISGFSNKMFYGGLLCNGVSDVDKTIPGVPPLTFVDYGDTCPENPPKLNSRGKVVDFSSSNSGEAILVHNLLLQLIKKGIAKTSISVITPYAAQRELISKVIQNSVLLNPLRKPVEEEVDLEKDAAGSTRGMKRKATLKTIDGLTVSSVDAFQGRENDVVVFTCVKSNSKPGRAFLGDQRRLNVALTRARKALIVVGHRNDLATKSGIWKKFSRYVEKYGVVHEPTLDGNYGYMDII